MCLPLAAVALVAAVGAAGLSAYGSIQSGNAQAASMKYQAAVARNNGMIAEANARASIDATNKAAGDKQIETARQIGSERAAAGAAGIDPNSGSPVDIQSGTAIVGKEDELTIRANGARQAYGYQVQGISDQQQGLLADAGASNAQTAGLIGGFTSILSGASSVAGKWDAYKTAGGGSGGAAPAPYKWDGVP